MVSPDLKFLPSSSSVTSFYFACSYSLNNVTSSLCTWMIEIHLLWLNSNLLFILQMELVFISIYVVYIYILRNFSHVWLFATLWIIALQAPLSMGFSRQEHWSGLPCPPLGDLPDLGIQPVSLTSPALEGRLFNISVTWEAPWVGFYSTQEKLNPPECHRRFCNVWPHIPTLSDLPPPTLSRSHLFWDTPRLSP